MPCRAPTAGPASRTRKGIGAATKVYGRLDCPSALGAIARGGYARQRVFFAGKATAIAAGTVLAATAARTVTSMKVLPVITVAGGWPRHLAPTYVT